MLVPCSSDSKSVTGDYSSEAPEDNAPTYQSSVKKCTTTCYADGSVCVVNYTTPEAIANGELRKSSYATVQLKENASGESVISIHLPQGCARVELVYSDRLPEVAVSTYENEHQQRSVVFRGSKCVKRSRDRHPFHPNEKRFILKRFNDYRQSCPNLHIKEIAQAIWKELKEQTFDDGSLNDDALKYTKERTWKSVCTLLYIQRNTQ